MNFVDVNEGNSGDGAVGDAYKPIMELAEQGIVNGKTEDRFYPWENVTRGQVAKMLANAQGLDTPEDVGEALSDYDDVDSASDYADWIASTTEAGIFGGDNGKFNEYDDLSREQMASALVRAFDLEDYDTGDDVEINKDHISEQHKDAVQTLANLDITKERDNFRAYDNISRAQFSSMLYRTMEVVETGENKEAEIDDVSVVNTKEAKVTFNKEVEDLDSDDISVKAADGNSDQVVKSVDMGEDNESATIEFYNELSADTTYNVNVTVGDLEPAMIEAKSEQKVQAGESTKVKFTAYDADGVNVTDHYDADDFTYTSNLVNSDGEVSLEEDGSTTTKVQYKDGSDVVAESDDITLTANATKVEEISNWTLGETNFDDENFERVTDAFEGDELNIEVKDQFGNEITEENSDYTFEYESQNPSVVIVDRNGDINKVNETADAPVKISVKNDDDDVVKEKTVTISAKESSELESISLDEESLDLSTADNKGVKVKGDLLDQYGDNLDFDGEFDVESEDTDNVEITDITNNDGEFDFNVKAAKDAEKGEYEVTVTAGEKEATLNVELVEHGVFDHYDVRGLEDSLDLNEDNEDRKTEMDVSVVPVDADGYATDGEPNNTPELTVKKDGEDVSDDAFNETESGKIELANAETGDYTVVVSIDDGKLVEHDFEVVDTSETADVKFTSSSLNESLNSDADVTEDLNEALTDIADIEATENGSEIIDGVEFTSNATDVIEESDGTVTTYDEGEATIYIDTVEIDDGDIDMDNQPINVEVISE